MFLIKWVYNDMLRTSESFNPLNQVYVFNLKMKMQKIKLGAKSGFNPLNQVYVFNMRRSIRDDSFLWNFVLIP